MPRVDCPRCGVVVASVPWAEPGSRFTRDFEAECAWLMTVANQKTVSGFLHVSWRTAGTVARRVAERVKASMPSPFDGLHAIGVDETSHRKGHTYITVVVDHERHRVIWAHDGVGGDVFDLFFKALTPEQHASIRVVTGDGARWIDPCVGRWRPNAERVLDGFIIVSILTYSYTACNSTIPLGCLTLHPVQGFTVGALRNSFGLRTKTGGKHFG